MGAHEQPVPLKYDIIPCSSIDYLCNRSNENTHTSRRKKKNRMWAMEQKLNKYIYEVCNIERTRETRERGREEWRWMETQ